MALSIDDKAPDFTLSDQEGKPWSLSAHRGTPVVIYFYPKDDTPGCTTQACDIRDHWAEFKDLGAEVVGISPDDERSHGKFANKHNLPHTLLADPGREVIKEYGAWGRRSMYGKEFDGVIRSSIVIDADGRVAAVFEKIKPAEQSAKSLEVLKSLPRE